MTSRYSRKVVQRQSIPASIAAPEISSARSRFRTTRARPDFELGAKVKPQLPMTAVVTPCQHDEDPKGSQCIWASRWVCPSMKRSEEHTSELQSLMRISYAVFCLKKKNNKNHDKTSITH